MTEFICPYLNADVELSDERKNHIAERHPDLLPDHFDKIADTLTNPDIVRNSTRVGNAKLFSRWYNDIRGGHHVVVVVICGQEPTRKNWIITAYLAKKIAEGEIEWKKN